MPSPGQIRRERIKNDIVGLQKIRCNAIDWKADSQVPDKINVTFNIRSIVGLSSDNSPVYYDRFDIEIQIPSDYPLSSPVAKMATGYKPIFHPNFWTSGLICTQHNRWNPSENLALFVIRLAKMFQFDSIMTDPGNPANIDAAKWYKSVLNRGFFPTDNKDLPLSINESDDDFEFSS